MECGSNGATHGCVVISLISRNHNGLDAVFQRMRKMQEIATSPSRLAMASKWYSSGYHSFSWIRMRAMSLTRLHHSETQAFACISVDLRTNITLCVICAFTRLRYDEGFNRGTVSRHARQAIHGQLTSELPTVIGWSQSRNQTVRLIVSPYLFL